MSSTPMLHALSHAVSVRDRKEKADFKIPRNGEDAKRLGQLLSRYSDRYYFTVLFGIIAFYIL